MPANQAKKILDALHRTAPRGDGPTDGQLLEAYIQGRGEAAFADLVRRHGPMVWGVCRRVVGNHHDAEDAFQATFLVLVRKAGAIAPREKVAGWLYGVACNVARKARAAAGRRRERQVPDMPEPAAAPSSVAGELEAILDQELSRLPAKYRLAIVLCDLEGTPRRDAARQMQIPEGTLSSRLTTARALLAKRLARHGLPVTAGALAAALPAAAGAAPPAALTAATVRAAGAFWAKAGGISAPVLALANAALRTLLLRKLGALLAALLALMVGAGVVYCLTPASGPGPGTARPAPKRGPAGDKGRAEPKERTAAVAKKEPEEAAFGITFDPGEAAAKDPRLDQVITFFTARGEKRTDVGVIRLRGLNGAGQATGAEAWLARTSIENALRHGPSGKYDPPGWAYGRGLTRLTLIPYRMGGFGLYAQSQVAVYRATVVPTFDAVMDRLYDAAVKDGKKIEFSVTPVYRDGGKPAALVIRANVPLAGDRTEVTIPNEPPPGPPEPAPREPGLLPEVARLKRRMPPPPAPTATGTAAGWAALEKHLGLTFPDDDKQFIRLYGEGEVNNFFRIPSPFSRRDWNNYAKEMAYFQDASRDRRKDDPRSFPYPVWPEAGGLLWLGSTVNGDMLYWRTAGGPGDWTVVLESRGGDGFFDSRGNLATFLLRVFDEEFQASPLTPGRFRDPKFVPYNRSK